MQVEKLNELDKKIKELQKKKKLPNNGKLNAKMYSMAINVTIELITGIGLGVILGIMLDNYLQTKPLMLIIFFVVGTFIGFYNMYKSLKKYGYFK